MKKLTEQLILIVALILTGTAGYVLAHETCKLIWPIQVSDHIPVAAQG